MNKEELVAKLGSSMEFQMVATLTDVIETDDIKVADLLDISFYKKRRWPLELHGCWNI
ncbi:hypothetical protein [Pedobacter steynii]